MDVSLKALRYFLSAVDAGNISHASRKMNVVPSAVLTAVNQVEDAFGLKLTLRQRSKGIELTATGRILTVKIRHLLDEYETLLKEGADLKNKLTGTLRVGYYAPVAPAFMPGIIEDLIVGNDDVVIKFFECDNQTAQDGLAAGTYDVIICVADSLRPGVTYETLAEVFAYLLVAEGHPLAVRKSVSLTDLDEIDMVLLDLPVVSEYYSQLFESAAISPRIVSTATTVEMVRSLVGSGFGCSVLHMRPLTQISYAGDGVIAIPFDPEVKPLRIVLAYLPDNPRRLVKAFVSEARNYFDRDVSHRLLVKN